MPAGEFKARCLEVMDRVARTRRPVTITKRGRPVARLVPIEPESEDFLGSLRDRIRIAGDMATPAYFGHGEHPDRSIVNASIGRS
jgi:prevent-host-death family protein